MRVINGLDSDELPLSRCALTVGNFDGVHLGHQQIIRRTGQLAEQATAPAVVLTFEPHPLSVVAPAKAPPRLTPLNEKLRWLEAAGADTVVVAESNRELLSLTAEEFIQRIAERLSPEHVVEGASFGFGRGRRGTPETLRQLGPRFGFAVCVLDPVKVRLGDEEDAAISSSLVRRLLAKGQVQQAALALGRRYTLVGQVVPGKRRGVTLGFPTVNLAVTDQLIPADGVYAGSARVADAQDNPWTAAVSIGTVPTFEDQDGRQDRKIEAHLLDCELNLYGRQVRLELGAWIREQRRFESAEALSVQIARDVEAVRRCTARTAGDPEPAPGKR